MPAKSTYHRLKLITDHNRQGRGSSSATTYLRSTYLRFGPLLVGTWAENQGKIKKEGCVNRGQTQPSFGIGGASYFLVIVRWIYDLAPGR